MLFILALVAMGFAGRFLEAPDVIDVARKVVREAGAWAPVAFGLGYVAATLVGVPGTPLTVVCALLFGTWEAFVIMVAATTVATAVSFLIARYLARPAIESRLGDDPRFRRVRAWVEQSPWVAIPFLRIFPFCPYALINYGLGLTRISFGTYIAASEVGMIPANALLVGLAGSLYRFVVRGETPWWLFAATLGAALLILLLGVFGKRALGRQEPQTA